MSFLIKIKNPPLVVSRRAAIIGSISALIAGRTEATPSQMPLLGMHPAAAGNTYATWNPLDKSVIVALSGGNLQGDITFVGGSTPGLVRTTIGITTQACYWEQFISLSVVGMLPGIENATGTVNAQCGTDADGWSVYPNDGHKYHSGDQGAYTSAIGAGFTFMTAYDGTAGKVWFGANGTWFASGNPATGANPTFSSVSGTIYPCWSGNIGNASTRTVANFGATAFTYSVPAGFRSGVYT